MKRIEPLRHYLVSEALCTWGFLLRGGLVTDLALPWGASCTSDPTKTRPSLPIRGEGSWRFRVQSSSNGESSGKQVRSTFTRARKHRGHTVRAGSEPFEGIPLTLGEDTTPEVIAHGVEFVALPGKAEKLQAVIPGHAQGARQLSWLFRLLGTCLRARSAACDRNHAIGR